MKPSSRLLAVLFLPLAACREEAPAPPAKASAAPVTITPTHPDTPKPPASTGAGTAAPPASGAPSTSAAASTSAAPSASAQAEASPLALPAQLQGKAVIVPKGDPDEARADLASAVKAPGEGGISPALVVRLTADVPVWRMWNGPAKKDANGRTNRLGQWWSYDAPHGTQQQYRTAYEVCLPWNELIYVAKCTLKKGAVVAIGPGNSVSPKTCGDPLGKEAYPAAPNDWQVWISKVWARPQELECPAETADYEADPTDISKPKKAAAKPAAASK
jgi:hypothetical protein